MKKFFFFFIFFFSCSFSVAASDIDSSCSNLLAQKLEEGNTSVLVAATDLNIVTFKSAADLLLQISFVQDVLSYSFLKSGVQNDAVSFPFKSPYYDLTKHLQSSGISEFERFLVTNDETKDFLYCGARFLESQVQGKTLNDFQQSDISFGDVLTPVKVENVDYNQKKFKVVYAERMIRSPGAAPVIKARLWFVIPENNYTAFNPYTLIDAYKKASDSYADWNNEQKKIMSDPQNYDVLINEKHRFTREDIIVKQVKEGVYQKLFTKDYISQLGGLRTITVNDFPFSSMGAQSLVDTYITAAMFQQKQLYTDQLAEISKKSVMKTEDYVRIRLNQVDGDFSSEIKLVPFIAYYTDDFKDVGNRFHDEDMYLTFATLYHLKTTSDPNNFSGAIEEFIKNPQSRIFTRDELGKNEIKDPDFKPTIPQKRNSENVAVISVVIIGGFLVIFFFLRRKRSKPSKKK